MGQYYRAYVNRQGKIKVFDNRVDGEWEGLKLMEHSFWFNPYVGNVINDLFYKKGQVCWVGDYYDSDNYYQVNCDNKELVKSIGDYVWDDENETKQTKCTRKKVRYLNNCLIVNHTKKIILDCDDYYEKNKWYEEWEGKKYPGCIHPLPLLTCSASHSGGSYGGTNIEQCGTWFNDVIEVVLHTELSKLIKKGYQVVQYYFSENE